MGRSYRAPAGFFRVVSAEETMGLRGEGMLAG
jgi:hypothetical protein